MPNVNDMVRGSVLGATNFDTSVDAYSFIAAGTGDGDAQLIVGSPCNVYMLTCSNINATARYFKVYNKATAATSADVPVFRFVVAPDSGVTGFALPVGIYFPLGLSFRLTTGSADNDSSEVAAGELIVNAAYSAA
jgi:hypothetical protein